MRRDLISLRRAMIHCDILGSPVFLDNFDNDDNWDVYDNDCFKSEITGGKFQMTAKGAPDFTSVTCWELTWPKVTDYYLEVTATSPAVCEGIDRWGLFLRGLDTKRGYALDWLSDRQTPRT